MVSILHISIEEIKLLKRLSKQNITSERNSYDNMQKLQHTHYVALAIQDVYYSWELFAKIAKHSLRNANTFIKLTVSLCET